MEGAFGLDLGRVRVHTGARNAATASAIRADAYTVGSDIVFAPNRLDPTSHAGRALLAHELAHVVQQRAASGSQRGARLSNAGDPYERAAEGASAAVLGGKPVPAQPIADAPVVARQPAAPKPGFVINVVVNEPVKGHEFCVRAVMQGHGLERDQAERLIDAGTLHCYGWAAEGGVPPEWVGHPIRFRIGDTLFGTDPQAANGAPLTPEPGEREDVNAETDRRFWERIGDVRALSKDRPEDEAYREVWLAERAQVLFERHDPFGPALRRFAAIGNRPAARSADDILPSELDAMLEVKAMLAQLTPRDWIRLRRLGLPETNWEGLAQWLPTFIAQQRADDRTIKRVSDFDQLGGLDSAYGTLHGEGRGSMDPAAPDAFERSGELEQAADDFETLFRARAVEKAIETFQGVHAVMDAASKRPLLSRVENDKLYALLQAANGPEGLPENVLRGLPVLRDPETFRIARNTMYASELGGYLSRRAAKWATDSQFLVEHLPEKPDVVFKFDAIVDATLKELGLDTSVHARIIRDWGKPDDSGLFSLLFHLGLLVMMFIPGLNVVAAGVFAVEAGIGSYEALKDYNTELKRWNRGERADAPSPMGVIAAGANLALSMLPLGELGAARGLTAGKGVLEEGAQIERLSTEARTAEALEGEAAGARTLADVNTAAEGQLAADVAGAPIEPVREPVKGGHHIEVTNDAITICSPDPCPLLRVEYAAELAENEVLAERLADIQGRLASESASEAAFAAREAAELRESLQYIRAHGNLFRGLPTQVTPELRARLARALDEAENAGLRLGQGELTQLGESLAATADAAEGERVVAGLENQVEAGRAARLTALASLDARIAEVEQEVHSAAADTLEYQAEREAAGKNLKGGPIKGVWNAKEELALLKRQKLFPGRKILGQAELVEVRLPSGATKTGVEIAGEGRIPDFVEFRSPSQVYAGDLKSEQEIVGGIKGGLTKPGPIEGEFRPTTKFAGQRVREQSIVDEARAQQGTIVIRGRNVLTNEIETVEVNAADYHESGVMSYSDVGTN